MLETVFVALVLICADGVCETIKVEAQTMDECRAEAAEVAGSGGTAMPCVEVRRPLTEPPA